MSMLKTETDIHTDEVIHRARAPTVALANNLELRYGFGAVRCNFPSTAYESNTVHPRLVAKSKANICTGTHSTHQDRGDHRKENKFNEVMITITND